MKKLLLTMGIIAICIISISQEIQHEAIAINIEVQVRVLKGDTFVDNLTMEDFEVYEDGSIQRVEAVYLIKKVDIEREESELPKEEARIKYAPKVARHFVLLFEVHDYLPKLGEAIHYFFDNVFLPEDTLSVVTPLKTYNIKEEVLSKLTRDEIAEQLKKRLRKDAIMRGAEYKSLIREIESLFAARDIPSEVFELNLQLAKVLLRRLEQLRYVDEEKLIQFSDYLKSKEGQKNVFMFYQKELVPQFNTETLNLRTSGNPSNPGILFDYLELSDFYRRDITFDVKRIKQVFSDSSISIHFLFLTKTPIMELDVQRMDSLSSHGISYVEHSEDIFSAFNEVAIATGGYTASSFNAASVFKKAVDASENYYLLYYTPKDYKSDGKFRNIKVRVKGGNFRVLHRAGYLAD